MKKLLLLFLAALLALALVACGSPETPETPETPEVPSDPVDPSLKNFEGLTLTDKTVTYNGEEHSVTVVGTLPEGATVDYTDNKATDAGTYSVKAVVKCEGYNQKTLTATLKINKASYDMSGVKWSYTSPYTYDGEEKSVTLSGLPEGVSIKAYSAAAATDAGDYTASVSLNYDTKNYNAPSVETCKWKINKAPITAEITFDSDTVEYDTLEHSIQIVGFAPAGTTVEYTYNGQKVSGVTEVGSYTVVATISGKNYITKTATATLTIKSTEKLLHSVNHFGVIYFQNALDDNKLYKVTNTGVSKVNNDVPEYFFSDGTDLYYFSSGLFSKTVKKISANGTVSHVCSVSGEYLTTDGEYLYYAVNNLIVGTADNGIWRYKLDGSQAEPVRICSDKAAYLNIVDGYVYFSNLSRDKHLYRVSVSGGTASQLTEEKAEYIINDGGVLYFDSSKLIGSAIYKYIISSGTPTKMTTDSGKYLTKVGNDIYYVNNDLLTSNLFGDGIYKISVLASGSLPGTKVISAENNGYSSLTSDGEYLYYYKLNDKHLYMYNPEDGTETDLLEGFVPPVEDLILVGDGVIAEYRGEIYYTNPRDGLINGSCLYKYNPTTGSRVKVLADDVAGVWFSGDYMYYSTCVATNYALFRMDMKTGEKIKVNSDRCENLIFDGEYIYYIKVDLLAKNKIMRIKAADVGVVTELVPEVIYDDKNIALTGMVKDGDTFYFVMNPAIGSQKLYKYTIGDSKAVDLDSKAFYATLVGNKVYFYDDYANAIKSCSTDGKSVTTVVSNVKVNDFYVDGDKLYYSSYEKTVGVFVYDTAKGTNTAIHGKAGEGLYVYDGKLWFIGTAVTYVADYPAHSGDGDGFLYCYDGTTVTKK